MSLFCVELGGFGETFFFFPPFILDFFLFFIHIYIFFYWSTSCHSTPTTLLLLLHFHLAIVFFCEMNTHLYNKIDCAPPSSPPLISRIDHGSVCLFFLLYLSISPKNYRDLSNFFFFFSIYSPHYPCLSCQINSCTWCSTTTLIKYTFQRYPLKNSANPL